MATLDEMKKAAETATYIDEDGEKKTGTILGSVQQAAAAAQKNEGAGQMQGNIDASATATNDAAKVPALQGYLKAAEGADYYDTQADAYKQIYDEQKAANQAAADAATEGTLAQIARQTEKLEAEYGKNDKALYRDYRQDLRNLPQQLAAMGITGGLSETSRVDLESGYGERLNESQLQRMAAIADLDARGEDARREADAAVRQQNAAALQSYYAALMQLGGQKYQEDIARKQAGAETLATMGDFSGYVELGLMTEEQAALMRQAWIAENPNLARTLGYVKSSGGGGGSRYYGPDGGDDGKANEFDDMSADAQALVKNALTSGVKYGDDAVMRHMGDASISGRVGTKEIAAGSWGEAYNYLKKKGY